MIFRISSISYVKRQVREHLISEQKYTFIIADNRNHVGYQYGDNAGIQKYRNKSQFTVIQWDRE